MPESKGPVRVRRGLRGVLSRFHQHAHTRTTPWQGLVVFIVRFVWPNMERLLSHVRCAVKGSRREERPVFRG